MKRCPECGCTTDEARCPVCLWHLLEPCMECRECGDRLETEADRRDGWCAAHRGYACIADGCSEQTGNYDENTNDGDAWCYKHRIAGVGPDAPVETAANGAKQSATPARLDLLPWRALLAVGAVLKHGADKYGEENWRGIPAADHLNHALVHIAALQAGDKQDDHAEHAACRILMWLETL